MFSMKKIYFVLSTAISSLLLATPAIAGSGFYGELSAGSAKNNVKGSYSVTSTYNYMGQTYTDAEAGKETSSDNSTSLGIRLGYQFNDYIAVEVGHHQYGEVKDNYVDEVGDTINDKIESSSMSAGIKGILPLSDNFSVFARAGIAKWDFKAASTDSSMPNETFKFKEDGEDMYYGIGAEYSFTEMISVGVEYSVLDMGWKKSESDTWENGSYSSISKLNYEVENILLLLKISF
jgi:opacity protein-like surface antigen